MSDPRCPRCGERGPMGQAMIAISFSMDDLEEIAFSSANERTRRRVVCAMSLLDEERAERVQAEQRSNGL